MFFSFKSSKSKQRTKTMHQQKFGITIITAGCFFSGKLFCKGASRVAGRIEGEINSQGLLVIENDAQINANITAEEVIIQGQVQGAITASKRVELAAKSSFSGNISCPRLVIQEGAKFDGQSSSKAAETPQDEKEQNFNSNLENISLDSKKITSPLKLNDISTISQ